MNKSNQKKWKPYIPKKMKKMVARALYMWIIAHNTAIVPSIIRETPSTRMALWSGLGNPDKIKHALARSNTVNGKTVYIESAQQWKKPHEENYHKTTEPYL